MLRANSRIFLDIIVEKLSVKVNRWVGYDLAIGIAASFQNSLAGGSRGEW